MKTVWIGVGYLVHIFATDLRRDSAMLVGLYLPGSAQKDSALRAIAPVARHGAPIEGDTTELLPLVSLGGRLGTGGLTITRPTVDELVSTGGLRLIESHHCGLMQLRAVRAAESSPTT